MNYDAMAQLHAPAAAAMAMADKIERERWQPIATAPKDGTHILIFIGNIRNFAVFEAHWSGDAYGKKFPWKSYDNAWAEHLPTFWMPRPKAPQSDGGSDHG